MKKLVIFTILTAALLAIAGTTQTQALSGSQFQAGRIIDDSVFFSSDNISPPDIQAFLNAKVPVCDTNGTQPYGGTTRAAYGTSQGYPPPYTCLRNYSQDTPTKAAESGLCNQYSGGTKSAASIIYDVAVACGVNARALIVMLQKEQSLITDDWPWSIQYRSAMGYGCPDTAPCDAEYYGFFNQVYNAARQLKRYGRDANLFSYRAGRDNFIQYNPNAACGGSNVFIQNQATASLYNYTPYQPNAAALNNLYGSGDGCSAYGNRNFWRMFNDWFGSVNGPPYYWQIASQEAYSDSSRTKPYTSTVTAAPGGKIYMRVKARNMGYLTWGQSSTYLGPSRPQDRNSPFYDSSWVSSARVVRLVESSVAPSQVGTFEFTLSAPSAAGSYKEYYNLLVEGQTWFNDIGLYYDINVVPPATAITSIDNVLTSGEELSKGNYIMSQDTQSILALQPDGNLVVYSNFSNPVWSSNSQGQAGTSLVMQPDGNLVLYTQGGTPVWASGTNGNPGARLALQTDGNLVIYSSSNVPLWNISVTHNPDHLTYVNTELHTAGLLPLQSLETANRKYKLVLQTDSNMVLYSDSAPIWASNTVGRNVSHLALQPDGNLVLYDKSGYVVWHTNTWKGGTSKLAIQPDGNLVLYNQVQATWNSNTASAP